MWALTTSSLPRSSSVKSHPLSTCSSKSATFSTCPSQSKTRCLPMCGPRWGNYRLNLYAQCSLLRYNIHSVTELQRFKVNFQRNIFHFFSFLTSSQVSFFHSHAHLKECLDVTASVLSPGGTLILVDYCGPRHPGNATSTDRLDSVFEINQANTFVLFPSELMFSWPRASHWQCFLSVFTRDETKSAPASKAYVEMIRKAGYKIIIKVRRTKNTNTVS